MMEQQIWSLFASQVGKIQQEMYVCLNLIQQVNHVCPFPIVVKVRHLKCLNIWVFDTFGMFLYLHFRLVHEVLRTKSFQFQYMCCQVESRNCFLQFHQHSKPNKHPSKSGKICLLDFALDLLGTTHHLVAPPPININLEQVGHGPQHLICVSIKRLILNMNLASHILNLKCSQKDYHGHCARTKLMISLCK